jgi:D-alanyl-D-alanine carboxypeptidase
MNITSCRSLLAFYLFSSGHMVVFPLLALVFICSAKASAQTWPSNKPVWLRADEIAAKLAEHQSQGPAALSRSGLTDALDQAFDAVCATTPIKGINAAMQLPDGHVWKRAHGFATELPFTTPLSTEHLMGMGSITKTFVSAALLTLVDDGLLSLQDTIGKFLPSYPNVSGKVTVRQMLSHRSGISDYLNENPGMVAAWAAQPDSIWAADTILSYYVLSPNFIPGTSWSYSNTNYLLAARIIEQLTGKTWYQFLRERILVPMGLSHTFAYPWETPGNQPFSHVWADFDNNGSVEDLQGSGLTMDGLFSLAEGAGCLISTPEDISRFNKLLFSGTLLKSSTLAAMQTDYLQNPASGLRYGLGAYSLIGFNPYPNWGHDGNLIYQSFALYFPTLGISIAVQQNDDRNDSPQVPMNDLVDVFVALFLAYLEYDPSSSAQDLAWFDGLKCWPNPATEMLTVQWDELPPQPPALSLVNVAGQTVAAEQVIYGAAHTFDLRPLPRGAYFLHVRTGSAVRALPVLVE